MLFYRVQLSSIYLYNVFRPNLLIPIGFTSSIQWWSGTWYQSDSFSLFPVGGSFLLTRCSRLFWSFPERACALLLGISCSPHGVGYVQEGIPACISMYQHVPASVCAGRHNSVAQCQLDDGFVSLHLNCQQPFFTAAKCIDTNTLGKQIHLTCTPTKTHNPHLCREHDVHSLRNSRCPKFEAEGCTRAEQKSGNHGALLSRDHWQLEFIPAANGGSKCVSVVCRVAEGLQLSALLFVFEIYGEALTAVFALSTFRSLCVIGLTFQGDLSRTKLAIQKVQATG